MSCGKCQEDYTLYSGGCEDLGNVGTKLPLDPTEQLIADLQEQLDIYRKGTEFWNDQYTRVLAALVEARRPWYVKFAQWAKKQWEADIYEPTI